MNLSGLAWPFQLTTKSEERGKFVSVLLICNPGPLDCSITEYHPPIAGGMVFAASFITGITEQDNLSIGSPGRTGAAKNGGSLAQVAAETVKLFSFQPTWLSVMRPNPLFNT